jgi:hypothetical protein
VETFGPLANRERRLDLEQVAVDDTDAVPGVHYEPFQERGFTIPAGQVNVSIPIVLKRDPSLLTARATLALRIKPNGDFPLVNTTRNSARIRFSDQLEMPSNWSTTFLGAYGRVKHRFLVEATGERWDYNFIYEVGYSEGGSTNSNYDEGYRDYYRAILIRELTALNATRAAQSLPPLAEEDGTEVAF